MKCSDAKILRNEKITSDIYRIELETSLSPLVKPGQFVQVQIPGFYLRRPISVCETNDNTMVLIYKTVGAGTEAMHAMRPGERINLFGPLGRGFPIEEKDVVLIGGGIGIPPLVETAKVYRKNGRHVTAVLGFNTKEQIFLRERLTELECYVVVATMDGTEGVHGTVLDAIQSKNISTSFVEACGPMSMLKAVSSVCQGYISLESRMACGIGACMGCVMKDKDGESLRVCKDGPVFEIGRMAL